jgi:hypothetical protein
VKPVFELKLCLVAPAAHSSNRTHDAASPGHYRRRESGEFMLAANTFEQRFQFAGTS